MNAKIEASGGCKILRVSGRIDFESALDFEHQINAMIQEGGDCFIIELSQVELLSSAGLRVMLSTAKRVAHRNASLALAAPSQVVRQVFEISHFNLLFKIFPSVPAAITALKGGVEIPSRKIFLQILCPRLIRRGWGNRKRWVLSFLTTVSPQSRRHPAKYFPL